MFDGFDQRPPERHRGFRAKEDLVNHVIRKSPKSCFYSTAYYQDPNQRKMNDKGWRGADLIFDLDGDHLPGVSDGDFPRMLEVIQEQAWRLWDDFLEPEYGFSEEHLQVTFSGHRGFHLHYRSPDIWSLDSSARRELVAHIKGEGVDVQTLLRGPNCSWKSRVTDGIHSVLSKLDRAVSDSADSRDARKELQAIIDRRMKSNDCEIKRCGSGTLLSIAEKVQDKKRREILEDGIKKGILKPVFGGIHDRAFRELVKGDGAVVLGNAGETDENVTVDIKRVIRWPTSLHGKSGFQVVEFELERLDPKSDNPFDPLSEAVPWQMGGELTKMTALKNDGVYRVGESTGKLTEGEVIEVDEATATFLVLKGWASPLN